MPVELMKFPHRPGGGQFDALQQANKYSEAYQLS
jgi:hypothetical protein